MIGNKLKQLRSARKLSQRELAKRLNVSQSTIAGWESGRTEPDHATIQNIADLFGVPVSYLFDTNVEAKYEKNSKRVLKIIAEESKDKEITVNFKNFTDYNDEDIEDIVHDIRLVLSLYEKKKK